MRAIKHYSIDYLLIGHLTQDLQDDGSFRLGGTVSYAGLTAHALGRTPCILSAGNPATPIHDLEKIELTLIPSANTTQFRNIPTDNGRKQYLFNQSTQIQIQHIPLEWSNPGIVHIAPVYHDLDPAILAQFPHSLVCLTPQGWMRKADENKQIHPQTLQGFEKWLGYAQAIVLSMEDLQGDLKEADRLASYTQTLVVTQRENGALVYHNGKQIHFPAPKVKLLDDTGSGDIFAACFFHWLHRYQNPWQAARFAVEIASQSVTREHFNSIPTQEEIQKATHLALEQAVYG